MNVKLKYLSKLHINITFYSTENTWVLKQTNQDKQCHSFWLHVAWKCNKKNSICLSPAVPNIWPCQENRFGSLDVISESQKTAIFRCTKDNMANIMHIGTHWLSVRWHPGMSCCHKFFICVFMGFEVHSRLNRRGSYRLPSLATG